MKLTDAWVFLLPEGWARFPAGEGRERELDEAIEKVVTRVLPPDLPRDSTEPLRRMARDRLRGTINDADNAGASVVYLPVQPIHGILIPASIIEVEFDSDAGEDPMKIVASVMTDGYDESEVLEVDGRPAARVTSVLREVESDPEWPQASSRQVVYTISRDEIEGQWLTLSFNVMWNSPQSEQLADALVLFFDAVMTTFRWAGDHGPQHLGDAAMVPGSARAA